jgi:tetratricopeptide (TPR) repeat protein
MNNVAKLFFRVTCGFFLATLVFPPIAPAQQEPEWEDIIIERDEHGEKKETMGSIRKESFNKITYIVPESGGTATGGVPTLRVIEVQYDANSKPADFSKAEAAYEAGNWRSAAELLRKCLKLRDLREVFKQQAMYRLAVCHENLGAPDKAGTAYQELIIAFSDSRYLREAHEGIINSFLARGNYDDAMKAVTDTEKAVKPLRLEPAFMLKLEFLKGRIWEEKKMYADAIRQYQKAGAEPTLEIAGEAKLGIGRCHMGNGKLQDAEDTYRKIVAEFTGTRADYIKAGAWNGVGDVCLKRAEAIPGVPPEKVQLFEQALWAYLRGVICWDRVEMTMKWTGKVDEFAKAMYFSAWCFDRLKDAYKADKAKMDTYKTRAQQLYQETREKFPGTRWGGAAEKATR